MSSAVPVPQRKREPASLSSSASSSYSSPSSRPSTSASKGKAPVTSSPSSPVESVSPRRPSLLGSSLAKSEHTVILKPSDGPLQLISCVKSSQGWDWNQDLFLPSYADYDAQDLEHKQDPVEEIMITDEEADAILPK